MTMASSVPLFKSRPAIPVLIAIAVCLAAGSASAGYAVTDLGVLPGGSQSVGMAVNLYGNIVATAGVDSFHTNAAFGSTSGLASLGTLTGGSNSSGFGINDGGQIAGSSEISVMTSHGPMIQTHAFRSSDGGSPQDLGTYRGDIASVGYAINGGGVVAGASYGFGGDSRAVLIYGKDAFVDLGTLGGTNAAALALNNNNVATGWAQLASGPIHAFITGPNGLQDLGVLPGFTTSQGQAINLLGQVVGFSGSPGSSAAFLYNPGSPTLVNLGVLPFGITSQALGINDSGTIVGSVGFSSGPSHGFVRDPATGLMIDLNSLLTTTTNLLITSATGVNDQNMIVGTAAVGNQLHAVLLTPIPGQNPFIPPPVPEPSSWLLLVGGGAGVALLVRTRRGKAAA
jgi:probable HAF family extracellular repeat protein